WRRRPQTRGRSPSRLAPASLRLPCLPPDAATLGGASLEARRDEAHHDHHKSHPLSKWFTGEPENSLRNAGGAFSVPFWTRLFLRRKRRASPVHAFATVALSPIWGTNPAIQCLHGGNLNIVQYRPMAFLHLLRRAATIHPKNSTSSSCSNPTTCAPAWRSTP